MGTGANTVPLQKRLTGLKASPGKALLGGVRIKQEPQDRPFRGPQHQQRRGRRRSSSSSSSSSRSPSPPAARGGGRSPLRSSSASLTRRRSREEKSSHMKPAVPKTVSMDGPSGERGPRDDNAQKGAYDKSKQIKLTLKSSTSAKPVSRSVLEKLGEGDRDAGSSGLRKRKASMDTAGAPAEKTKKSGGEKKKDKKSAADRREELLKQLKAVENAIAKKRTK